MCKYFLIIVLAKAKVKAHPGEHHSALHVKDLHPVYQNITGNLNAVGVNDIFFCLSKITKGDIVQMFK